MGAPTDETRYVGAHPTVLYAGASLFVGSPTEESRRPGALPTGRSSDRAVCVAEIVVLRVVCVKPTSCSAVAAFGIFCRRL